VRILGPSAVTAIVCSARLPPGPWQASGINTVTTPRPILESAGVGTNAALLLTIVVAVHEVILTVVGIILLGPLNRRRMVEIGYVGVSTGHLLLALMLLLPASPTRAYLILAAMLLVVAFVEGFVGTLPGHRRRNRHRPGQRHRVARVGAQVVLLDRNKEALDAAVEAVSDAGTETATSVVCDLTDARLPPWSDPARGGPGAHRPTCGP
jgi:hypothetical protein